MELLKRSSFLEVLTDYAARAGAFLAELEAPAALTVVVVEDVHWA